MLINEHMTIEQAQRLIGGNATYTEGRCLRTILLKQWRGFDTSAIPEREFWALVRHAVRDAIGWQILPRDVFNQRGAR